MEYKRVFKDGSNLLFGNVGSTIIGLINLIILTRILSTEQMGIYSLFLMVVNLAVGLGLGWSDSSILRHGREEFVKHKKINQSFWARCYLFFPMLLFLIVINIIFKKQILNYIGIETNIIFLLIMAFILFGLLKFMINIHRSIDNVKKSAYLLFFQKIIYLFGLLYLYFNMTTINFKFIFIFFNLSFLFSLIYSTYKFNFKLLLPYKYNKKYFKKIWSYSWPQFIGFSGLYVINYVDLFVIRKFLTLSDVGVYDVAYKGFLILSGIILLINTIFLPLIVEYKTKKQFKHIKDYFKKIPIFTLGWAILVIIGIILSKFIFLLIFSEKYLGGLSSFRILLIASIIFIIYTSFTPLINAFDLVLQSQIINIFMGIVNIIFDFMLIPIFGIIGAAYGTLIAYIVGLLLRLLLINFNKKKIFGLQ
jgi:O-antigen/teichoic acid export membrane protein